MCGFGVSNFIFCRLVAFLFCVTATYVIRGAIFGSFFTLGSVAVFGIWEVCNGIACTLGSDPGKSFAG